MDVMYCIAVPASSDEMSALPGIGVRGHAVAADIARARNAERASDRLADRFTMNLA
jgi:hypothetical protein